MKKENLVNKHEIKCEYPIIVSASNINAKNEPFTNTEYAVNTKS